MKDWRQTRERVREREKKKEMGGGYTRVRLAWTKKREKGLVDNITEGKGREKGRDLFGRLKRLDVSVSENGSLHLPFMFFFSFFFTIKKKQLMSQMSFHT